MIFYLHTFNLKQYYEKKIQQVSLLFPVIFSVELGILIIELK